MDKVTVNQLAEEFQLDPKAILKELKKIGVMVFSANQPLDPRFIGKVQAHLKLLSNLTHEEEKRAERKKQVSKKKVVKVKPKKPELTPLETAISKDMTIRRAQKTEELPGEELEELVEEEIFTGEPGETVVAESGEPAVAVPEEEEVAEEVQEEKIPRPPQPEVKKASKDIMEEIQRKARLDKAGKPAAEPEPVPEAEPREKPREPQAASEPAGLIVREIQKEKKREKGKVLKRSTAAPVPGEGGLAKGLDLFKTAETHKKKAKKKRRQRFGEPEMAEMMEDGRELSKITLPEGLSVKELSERMETPVKDILKFLFMKGIMVNINQILDMEVVQNIGREFGFDVTGTSFEEELFETEFLESETPAYSIRPPVITVMGHVDHGKTSLLDAIRKTAVAAGEAGGITQHIGAYMVEVHGRKITFIDTPGHEAFTMMRARGAQITDIVVLVVAADDGVMPQTVEAIQHARAANVPLLVAINKIDKPGANIERVKRGLAEMELLPEEWGGKTIFVEVSAKKGINIDHLLEMILLTADIQELKGNPNTKAMGTVIESRLDRNRGALATLLVQNGTLFERDIIVAGPITGKIRAMYDENNQRLDMAGPSTPVMVLGLEDLPAAGEKFFATDDVVKARQLSIYRSQKQREEALKRMNNRVSLETFFQRLQEGQVKELPIILKVDVQGSKDAIESLLNKLSTDKVKIIILHSAVGAITENDVLLASASNAIVVGFSVKPVRSAEELAKRENVDIRFYNVIYSIADEIKKAMEGLLEYTTRENVIGTVEIRDTFKIPGIGMVVGGYVSDGMVRRDAHARIFRDGVLVYQGKIASLKRFKEDVTEVKNNYECGLSLEKYNDFKVGDELQIYTLEKVRDSLDS